MEKEKAYFLPRTGTNLNLFNFPRKCLWMSKREDSLLKVLVIIEGYRKETENSCLSPEGLPIHPKRARHLQIPVNFLNKLIQSFKTAGLKRQKIKIWKISKSICWKASEASAGCCGYKLFPNELFGESATLENKHWNNEGEDNEFE